MIFFTSGANLVRTSRRACCVTGVRVAGSSPSASARRWSAASSSVFITTRLRHPSFIVLTLGAILLVSKLLIARVAEGRAAVGLLRCAPQTKIGPIQPNKTRYAAYGARAPVSRRRRRASTVDDAEAVVILQRGARRAPCRRSITLTAASDACVPGVTWMSTLNRVGSHYSQR